MILSAWTHRKRNFQFAQLWGFFQFPAILRVYWNFQINWGHFTQFYLPMRLCHFFFKVCAFYWLKCSNVYSFIHFKGTDHHYEFFFFLKEQCQNFLIFFSVSSLHVLCFFITLHSLYLHTLHILALACYFYRKLAHHLEGPSLILKRSVESQSKIPRTCLGLGQGAGQEETLVDDLKIQIPFSSAIPSELAANGE